MHMYEDGFRRGSLESYSQLVSCNNQTNITLKVTPLVYMYTLGKTLWPQIFNCIAIALIIFQTSQQLHDIFNAYSPLYVSIFVKIQPILTEQWTLKAVKVCKNQTQVCHSLTSLWSPCLAARPLWQECTRLGCVHSVSSDAMGIHARTLESSFFYSKAQI